MKYGKITELILEYEHYIVLSIIPIFLIFLMIFFQQNLSYWMQYWWMFPIALIIAITVNTAGISGAALFVPFFILIFPLFAVPLIPEQSIKLGLITESFGLSSSALAFIRYGLTDTKFGFSLAIKSLPFVIIGSLLSFYLPNYLIYFIISAVLTISIYLLINKKRTKSKLECIHQKIIGKHHKRHSDQATLTSKDGKVYKYCRSCGRKKRFFGFSGGGIFQGLSGFGIGELGIVSMLISKIPLRVAIGTNHIIVAITAITASITHLAMSYTNRVSTPWNIVFMTVPAVIIGGQIAPYVAAKIKSSTLEYFISGLFVILSVSLIYLGVISI